MTHDPKLYPEWQEDGTLRFQAKTPFDEDLWCPLCYAFLRTINPQDSGTPYVNKVIDNCKHCCGRQLAPIPWMELGILYE